MQEKPTDRELADGNADHDCRERVVRGRADHVDLYRNAPSNWQAEFECDLCGRTVYVILEPYNVQIEQTGDEFDGSVIEPHHEIERHEIWDSDTLGPA
jgi:hypothetical protein